MSEFDLLPVGKDWHIHHGDAIPHMLEEMPPQSVDFTVHSPAFPAMYAYGEDEADMGNVNEWGSESRIHFKFYFQGLARVLKPGRVAIVHCCQIPRMKRTGGIGMFDFRGTLIRIAERAGLIYEFDWLVRKNPQSQALRTRSRELQFVGLEKDRAASRGAIADYLLKFRAPGENEVPIDSEGQVSRDNWINWAESAWLDVSETDTLNTLAGKGEDDTRHICALQLEVIRRLILLYSNPGEIVFSPFAGIGSEGYMAIGGRSPKTGRYIDPPRRFYGCELKPEYYKAACANFARVAEQMEEQPTLF